MPDFGVADCFLHIYCIWPQFTDEELYKKYNLTDEEINIIESVIKENDNTDPPSYVENVIIN